MQYSNLVQKIISKTNRLKLISITKQYIPKKDEGHLSMENDMVIDSGIVFVKLKNNDNKGYSK